MTEKVKFRRVVGNTLTDIKKTKTRAVDAIPTPIPDWNQLCGEEGGRAGIAKTWTVVVGGMPGSRKSYLALNLAAHAVEQGRLVGAINFEMSFAGYATRFLSVLTGVPKDQLGWGAEFSSASWDMAVEKANEIYQSSGGALITNDATVFTLSHIEDAYEAFADHDVELVIVDYVQLVKAGQGDLKERAGAIAETLRTLSHKHRIATVALSQINRSGMKGDSSPKMSDLYGGMYWEANANQVVMLDHTFMEDDEEEQCTRTQLLVDKNRAGRAVVEIPIRWNWDTMRVEQDISYQQAVENMIENNTPEDDEDDFFDAL